MSDLINDYWTKTPPSPDPHYQTTYEFQRKCRTQDAIDDYLQDDRVSARRAYEEILSCVDDVRQYHKDQYDKANELYNLMLGNRDPFPSE